MLLTPAKLNQIFLSVILLLTFIVFSSPAIAAEVYRSDFNLQPDGSPVVIWEPGTTHNITWNSPGSLMIWLDIYYSTDGGTTWDFIVQEDGFAGGPSFQDNSYSWTIPAIPASNNCKVKIRTYYDGTHYYDTSDETFTIASDDIIPPTGSISMDAAYGEWNTSAYNWDDNSIHGYVSDTGGSVGVYSAKVAVMRVSDSLYFQESLGWVNLETWNDAQFSYNKWFYSGLAESNIDEGENYVIRLKAQDYAGNFAETTPHNFIYDTSGPSVSVTIERPWFGPNSFNIDSISGTANDASGIDYVELTIQKKQPNTNSYDWDDYWNGTSWQFGHAVVLADHDEQTGNWTYPISSSLADVFFAPGVSEGYFYNIAVLVFDNDGLSVNDRGVFTWEATEPTSQINNMVDFYDRQMWESLSSISGTSNDDLSGVEKVEVAIKKFGSPDMYWDNTSGTWISGGVIWNSSQGNAGWSYISSTPIPFIEGSYIVYSRAYDFAGNYQTTSYSHSFVLSEEKYYLSGTISGPYDLNISQINVELYEDLMGSPVAITQPDSSGNYSFSNLINGQYYVKPESKSPQYVLSPTDYRSVVISNSHLTGINFVYLKPIISINHNEFSFIALKNRSNPANQILTISNIGNSALTYNAIKAPECAWLNLNNSQTNQISGSAPDSIDLSIDASGLSIEVYSTVITIESNDIDNPEIEISITLEIKASGSLLDTSLGNTGTRNHPNPFNPTIEDTLIIFNAPYPEVKIIIYDLRAKALWARNVLPESGDYYSVVWDGKSDFGSYVGNGSYIYLIIADGEVVDKGQLGVWK